MDLDELKEKILCRIALWDSTDIAELSKFFPRKFKGDKQWFLAKEQWKKKRYLIWDGISKEFMDALNFLENENYIISNVRTDNIALLMQKRYFSATDTKYVKPVAVFFHATNKGKNYLKEKYPELFDSLKCRILDEELNKLKDFLQGTTSKYDCEECELVGAKKMG